MSPGMQTSLPIPVPNDEGSDVLIEPVTDAALEQLFGALNHDAVWAHLPWRQPRTAAELESLLASGADRQPMIIRHNGTAVGTTSYYLSPFAPSGFEIGGTALSPATWGTGLNATIKHHLLTAAFAAGARNVLLRTDERNERSAAAIAKLPGAVELERRIEPQIVRPDGTVRTSRVFEITRAAFDRERHRDAAPFPSSRRSRRAPA